MNNKFVIRIVILLLFLPTKFFSQNIADSKSIYKWFDSIVGVGNSGIYNGVVYKNEYKNLIGNDQFYITSDFLFGEVVYDKQPFYNIQMKYDVYSDELIVKLPSEKAFIIIKLIKTKIKSFTIEGSRFVGVYKDKINSKFEFFEVLYEAESLKILKKHKKEKKVEYDRHFVYNKFKDKVDYYLVYNEEFHEINSKRDIIRIFPNYKKDIMSLLNSNRGLYRQNFELYLIRLAEFINNKIFKKPL